ncbi:MAG: coproporphyrinogen III oxidase [Deltaproteobacteria bacterium]|nr:MAG: coproporphyrinogen III oxidase [Deltaproteobacteria bacterium]
MVALSETAPASPAGGRPGIYIHVPFCLKKCAYCDFYSVSDTRRMDAYADALIQEIHQSPRPCLAADTVYFGGGTPTVLPVITLERILEAVYAHFHVCPDAEITLEANPGTVTRNALADLHQLGISRLNLGVQSFHDEMLALLERLHDRQTALDAISFAVAAGYENIGIDLIYGLPHQRLDTWEQDLGLAVSLPVQHLSCYSLTYEPGTPLDSRRINGTITPLGEDHVADMVLATYDILVAGGFDPYEISNYARCDKTASVSLYRSRHNMKYWEGAAYVGLGPGAHSFDGRTRGWNHPDLDSYICALLSGTPPPRTWEHLTREQQAIEAIYLGLRTCEGLDLSAFERLTGVSLTETAAPFIALMLEKHHLEIAEARIRMTRTGRLYLDAMVAQMIDLLSNFDDVTGP